MQVEHDTAQSMQMLLKLDTIKSRMTLASDALKVHIHLVLFFNLKFSLLSIKASAYHFGACKWQGDILFLMEERFHKKQYCKVPKFSEARDFSVIHLKFKQRGHTCRYFVKNM